MIGDTTHEAPAERLTRFSHGAGCACKLSPGYLEAVLRLVPALADQRADDLLVGLGGSDDAAVFRLSADLALVFTTDFFTPIVDDAFDWGRISAANALSDVYAMGGRPILALNLVAWPRETLPAETLARVLEGGLAVAQSAGCLVVGGHSIDDAEPKYGMAVVGTVHPDRVLANSGARPGDVLVLTKPLGVGAVTTAAKNGQASPELLRAAVDTMTTLNVGALEAAAAVGIGDDQPVHGATDITGFGLLGHTLEMATASGVSIEIDANTVPTLAGARELIAAGMVSGGTRRNHEWVAPSVDWGDTDLVDQYLLTDAQTSGGLLVSCAREAANSLINELQNRDLHAAAIGRAAAPARDTGDTALLKLR